MKKTGHVSRPIPEEDIRKDSVGHLPMTHESRGTCKYPGCKGVLQMAPDSNVLHKCEVHLCCEHNSARETETVLQCFIKTFR